MAIDLVCKMTVDEKKAAATSGYKGKKYYFCAVGCKKAFDHNPEKYIAPGKKQANGYDCTIVRNSSPSWIRTVKKQLLL